MDYHPVTTQIQNVLQQNAIWYESFEHEPVRTSEQAARTRPGYTLHQGAKAILLRIKRSNADKFFVMLVFPADLQFDTGKVKTFFNARDIRFATDAEVGELAQGIEPGGVPPFGNLFELRVIADPKLFAIEKIVFNAGDRRFSIAMLSADYARLVNPEIVDITNV